MEMRIMPSRAKSLKLKLYTRQHNARWFESNNVLLVIYPSGMETVLKTVSAEALRMFESCYDRLNNM